MNANHFESEKSVKSFNSLGVANAVNTSKPIMHVKISLPLNIVAALILIYSVVLPVQAKGVNPTEQTQEAQTQQPLEENNRKHPIHSNSSNDKALVVNSDKWSIAKTNVDKFLELNNCAIGNLFGYPRLYDSLVKIDLDEKLDLKIFKCRHNNEFCFMPTRNIPHGYIATGPYDGGFDYPNVPSEAIWTGVKRKDEKDFWIIIKANLDKFIGMSGEEIKALLGPERESSKPWNYIKYRVGDAGLTFYLKEGKVQKFKFKADDYIPGT